MKSGMLFGKIKGDLDGLFCLFCFERAEEFMEEGFNGDNTKQSIGYRDCAGKKKGGKEKCGEFPEIILKKLIEKLSDKRERKNGKNSEKNRLNAYLPPSFLKKRTVFV